MACAASPWAGRYISDAAMRIPIHRAKLKLETGRFTNRSMLIRTHRQLPTVLALLALDGIARRLLLCPTDIGDDQIPRIMEEGEVECILSDEDLKGPIQALLPDRSNEPPYSAPCVDTEWILFTSGTSGFPKLVQHSLKSLSAPVGDGVTGKNPVWSTFYDIRRYGGLQILLRALLTGGSIVLSAADEPVAAFLHRLEMLNATHISGTPSHWRRVIMSGDARRIAPSYVRLSGEISDQPILDKLSKTYSRASIVHAFASTEAGVVFGVTDGQAGFPESFLEPNMLRAEMRIADGTLRVRSDCTALRYLGKEKRPLEDENGFIDTGDILEYQGGRYYFSGRREGVVNVGGHKVYPEEVEAVINRHPEVLMSRVWGRPSPITGTLIAADVVLTDPANGGDFDRIRSEIIGRCTNELRPHKVPARLSQVREISMMTSGKIERRHA